jgi:hypothetical protein
MTQAVDADLAKALAVADAITQSEDTSFSEIADPPGGHVRLPGGLVLGVSLDDAVYDVEVRELTGEHEEIISRARRIPSPARFVSALLECGVVSIGGEPAKKSDIKRLLIGDRDTLLLEIRRATYGDELEFERVVCPGCAEMLDITITLDEVPIQKLPESKDRQFTVKLRKGGEAVVRLPNGEDQEAILEDIELTDAERNSILLRRCVLQIIDSEGKTHQVAPRPSLVNNLGLVDRRKILNEITKRQPGPRYDEVSFTHEACGKEVPLPLGLGDLFPYL